MTKKIIRLTESDLHRIVKESVKKVIREGVYTPNLSNPKQYSKQINGSGRMQRAVNNGGQAQAANEYISNTNTYYGAIAKIAKENNTTYTDILNDLQDKITYYLQNGYFGEQKDVVTTIQLFTELLAYLHGAYESAVSSLYGNRVNEGLGDWFDGLGYKDTNRYGVRQKIKDKGESPYAVNQRNGQWMTDLQNELKQLLQWKFLHGKKTVEATKAFIEFLNVEKRGLGNFNIGRKSIRIMYISLIGLTLLLSGDGARSSNPQGQINQPPQTQQTAQQAQNVTINFNVNSSTVNPAEMEKIQSLANYNGPITLIVHQSQNSNGQDASYESHLALQRAQAIMNVLGKKCNVVRGTNSQTPSVEIQVSQFAW